MDVSDLISVSALAFSGFAAWQVTQRTEHAQRQADAAAGELPPNFSLRPVTPGATLDGPVDTFLLRVENHNRRPIRLGRLAVEKPKRTGVVAYLVEPPRDTLLGSLDRRHNEVETNIFVEGTRPGAPEVSALTLKLVLAGPTAQKPDKRQDMSVAVRVDYEVLSATPEPHSERVLSRLKSGR